MKIESQELNQIIERAREQHRAKLRSLPGGSLLEERPKHEPKQFRWINTSQWDSEPCPAREWAVKDRVPLRQVTLLSGEGSIGKSVIELMCCVAHVIGRPHLTNLPLTASALFPWPAKMQFSVRQTAITSSNQPSCLISYTNKPGV
jgi:hypothetical protein